MVTEKVNSIIFQLLQASLFGPNASIEQDFNFSEDIDWNDILKELEAHTVAAIPCEYIMQSSSVPAGVKQKWMNLAFYQVGQWVKLMSEQDELVRLMRENNIEMAIIKGSAAAIQYPHPEYRAMGDIDFIVKRGKFDKACQIMLDSGYTFANGEEKGKQHIDEDRFAHTEFEKNGVIFELHKELARIQDEKRTQYFQELVNERLEQIEIRKVEEYQFPIFSNDLNGLILLRHIVQHLGGERKRTGITPDIRLDDVCGLLC